MFRAVAMLQLTVVMLERDTRAVLRALGELGAIQLRRTPAGPDSAPLSAPDRAAELARCERLVARVEELRNSLGSAARAEDQPSPPEMTFEQAQSDFTSIEQQADPLLKRRQHLLERWGGLTSVCEQMSGYRGLDIPLDGPDRFSFLHFVSGDLPAENLEKLQKEVGAKVALLPLPTRGGRQPLLAMTTRQGRPALESALEQAGFQRETLPVIDGGTVDMLSEASLREQASATTELQEANEQLRMFAAKVAPSLAGIEQTATVERRLLEAERNFPRTESAVLLSGWVPADERATLEQRLRDVTGGRCVIETASAEEMPLEQIPVLLRHPRVLRPFEMLVTAYGLPSYQELEPTLFVALSYVLMFGMMFGDAGHGSVLAAGGLTTLLAGRTRRIRDVGVLLLFGGLSSMVFGAVYGSCFGLPQLKQYALWHDPLEGDPMVLMYGAIRLGVVMISLGLILNIINCFRRGDVLGGFLDKFGVVGLMFYWGMLTLLIQHAAIESRGLVNLALGLFLVLPIVGWSLKEPLEYARSRRAVQSADSGGGFGAALTESLVGAFEAVLSYLANTISFVRLAAYAMSHAALLVAAFMMAAEVRHLSFGGGLLSVLVIIAGNVVAIILEGIIASVQALRLEYYEFFGKFFSGSGRPFDPFRLTAVRWQQCAPPRCR
jgi:V/A-type H+-transporting ATPase subunit I